MIAEYSLIAVKDMPQSREEYSLKQENSDKLNNPEKNTAIRFYYCKVFQSNKSSGPEMLLIEDPPGKGRIVRLAVVVDKSETRRLIQQ